MPLLKLSFVILNGIKGSLWLYELEKSRVNNSQQMLQALEEQDLTKAEHYFVKL